MEGPQRARKGNRSEIEERRSEVQRLRVCGLAYVEIASQLGVNVATVKRDLAAIREENQARIDPTHARQLDFDREAYVGEMIREWDEARVRAEQLLAEAEKAEDALEQRRAIRLIMDVDTRRLKAYLDVGLLSRAAHKVEHELPPAEEHPVLDQALKDPVVRALIEKTFKRKLQGPTPDVVDGEAVPAQPRDDDP